MPELLKDDLLQISQTLYSPKEEELRHREIFQVNTEFLPWAEDVGYDVYTRKGSAKILAHGAAAKDVPFVGELKERFTQKAYTVASGIRYTAAERMAMEAARSLGKGPVLNLDQLRVATARRFIFEQEHRLAILGNASFGIKGLMDSTFYGANKGTSSQVAEGAGTAYIWSSKTPQEILADLNVAKSTVEANGLFKARILVLPWTQYNLFNQPYSASTIITLKQWLEQQGAYFEKIIPSNCLGNTYSAFGTDCFIVLDNDREICELAVLQEMDITDPVYDILETSEQAAYLRTAGIIMRHPAAIYRGYHI